MHKLPIFMEMPPATVAVNCPRLNEKRQNAELTQALVQVFHDSSTRVLCTELKDEKECKKSTDGCAFAADAVSSKTSNPITAASSLDAILDLMRFRNESGERSKSERFFREILDKGTMTLEDALKAYHTPKQENFTAKEVTTLRAVVHRIRQSLIRNNLGTISMRNEIVVLRLAKSSA